MRISDWSSDVCSSDLSAPNRVTNRMAAGANAPTRGKLNFIDPVTLGGERPVAGLGLQVADQPAFCVTRPRGLPARSEDRRVGQDCASTCRYRWSSYH